MITDVKDVYEDDIRQDLKLSNQELDEWSALIDKVEVGPEVLNTIQVVKVKIEEHNVRIGNSGSPIIVNDRRWKKMIRLMRSSAFLNGRDKVDLMDCFLMNHCLWSIPDHQQIIRDILADAIAKHGYTMAVNLSALKKEVQEFQDEVEKEIRIPHTRTIEKLIPVEDEYFRLDKQDNKFQGSLVKIEQYRTLSIDEPRVTNFLTNKRTWSIRSWRPKGKLKTA